GLLVPCAVIDDQSADAGVGNEDVAAAAQHEDRRPSFFGCVRGASELIGGAHGYEDVGRPTDAKRRVAGQRFSFPDVPEFRYGRCQSFAVVHCNSSSSFGPTSMTSPAPMVKITSPGCARA